MTKRLTVGLLAGIVLGIASSSARAVDRDAVNRAIDKGVAALRTLQGTDGTWRHPAIGATALAGLTLLECGAPADDKAVVRAANATRRASLNLTHNYSIALAILFFDRLGDPADIPLIESLTVRLLAGQSATGGWNYDSPPVSNAEVRRLRTKLARRKERIGQPELSTPGAVKRTAKDLPKEIQQQLAALHRRAGSFQELGSDNSNTQFATLALWVGRRYGLPVGPALKRVEARFRNSQNADGGWGYYERGASLGRLAGSSASMTCAGLLGLAVANGKVAETAQQKDGKLGRDIHKDTHLRKGLLALSTAIGQPQAPPRRGGFAPPLFPIAQVGGRTYYFLWSMERVAVALDLQTLGEKDWYGWGAEILLANQQVDGTWQGSYGRCGADTCFALLFLKRANLVPDLTTQLAGKLPNIGERTLKGSGVRSDALMLEKITALKPGIEREDTKAHVESKEARPIAKPLDSTSARMANDLVKASGSRHTELLKLLRSGKGVEFTEALALAIPQSSGENKRKARTALTERLTRMKDATLTNYLGDEDAEIRRAAALACACKGSKTLIPHLIPLLRDPRQMIAEAAHEALKDLTGQDFGPVADASREERDRSARQWLSWWNKQERK